LGNIPKAFYMRKSVYAFPCLFLTLILFSRLPCHAQPNVSWGKEFQMHKSTSDLSVVHVDASGVFLEEADRSNGGFSTPGKGNPSLLMKMNASFDELYHKDYDKELKGKSMTSFLFVHDKLYLFASTFDSHEKNAYLPSNIQRPRRPKVLTPQPGK
jgi:hypothetical protein